MDDFLLPREVAECPECGAPVALEVLEWDTETGVPTDVGCYFRCTEEDDSHYRQPYVDWLPVELAWYRWVEANITVPLLTHEEELRKLAAWEAWAKGTAA